MDKDPHVEDEDRKPDERDTPDEPDEERWWELQLGLRLLDGLYTESDTGR